MNIRRTLVNLSVLLCISSMPALGEEDPGVSVEPSRSTAIITLSPVVQSFTWREYFDDGTSLKEDGYLFGLNADIMVDFSERVRFYVQSMIYGGSVDYDGYTVNIFGESRPYRSDTGYFGMQSDFDLGYDVFADAAIEVQPFLGIGIRDWVRSLDEDGRTGYDEHWWSIHGRAGIRLEHRGEQGRRWYLFAALIMPIDNEETAEDVPLARDDDIELEPEQRLGYQAEAGVLADRIQVALFYEELNFGKSDVDSTGGYYQPKSEKNVAGLKIGYAF